MVTKVYMAAVFRSPEASQCTPLFLSHLSTMPADRTPTNTTFRFQGRRGLLTYSHLGNFFFAYNFTVAVIPHIQQFANADFKWKWAIEQHHDEGIDEGDLENGSFYVHVCFDLGKANSERGHIFDFQGQHPNLKKTSGSQQWKNQLKYLERDHVFESNIEEEDDEERQENGENIWKKALSMSDYESFSQTLREEEPKDFCKSYLSIRECGKDLFKEKKTWTPTHSLDDFPNTPQLLKDYANFVLSDEVIDQPKALIIISETRFGKTNWARTITPDHTYVNTEWNPDSIKDDCRLLIFDNIEMAELLPKQRWKAFFGMQHTFNITGKYRGSREVNRGWKGFIYLSNTDPRLEVDKAKARYITLNSHIITLDKPLF